MMISNVPGRFESFTGNIEIDEIDPEKSTVDVKIEAASINTREPQRDGHLKSPDFLNVEQYPYLTFTSKRVEKLDQAHGRIIGDLTIRNITKEVVLDVGYAGQSKSPWGKISAGFTATTKLNRSDWDLSWNVALETGGWLVGDIVNVNIELEVIKLAAETA
jgi:polyisoprenoid-binding protein YceI